MITLYIFKYADFVLIALIVQALTMRTVFNPEYDLLAMQP